MSTLSKKAFHAARAAYATGVKDFGPEHYTAPTSLARMALDDMGVARVNHWRIMQAVWKCVRPGAQRVIDSAQACEDFA